ncbi:MAG: YfhO family protein [Oscillospiraceae bacterium]|jgi:hypothetical protein|nr:YfhO family protein [Oscillospiraceae bacterium]
MSGSTCETYGENRRELMMLKAILLEPEQIDRYGDVLRPFSESLEREPDEYGYAPTLDPNFDDDAYAADCMARKAAAAYYFSRDNSGFTSKINLPKANLVFYSVPYEEGWTATVDGEPVTVEKVNKGFMAVPVPAGDHTIRFNYATPGLKPGLWVSFGSLVLLVAYVLGFYFFKKGKPKVAYSAFGEDSGVARGVSNLERDDKNVSDRFYSGQLADAEYEFGIDPYQTSIAGAFYTPGQADGFPERVILEQTPPTHNNQDLPYYLPKNETIPETDTPSESETPDPEEGDLNVNKPTSTPNGVPIDYDYSFNFDNPEEK